jgi:hypothetical protein
LSAILRPRLLDYAKPWGILSVEGDL